MRTKAGTNGETDMLKGQAKTDYMREYMRKRRGSNKGLTKTSKIQGSNNKGLTNKPKQNQSYNRMMVGYVPPQPQENSK